MRKRLLFFFALLAAALSGCSAEVSDNIQIPQTEDAVNRGQRIAEGLAACGFCHGTANDPGAPLVGGRVVYDSYGAVKASNITGGDAGIKRLTDKEIADAIRGRWSTPNRSPDIHTGYEWMSTKDLFGVVAYLRSLPAVERGIKGRSVSFLSRNTTGLFKGTSYVPGYVPEVPKSRVLYYGKYLVDNVARCGFCHSSGAASPGSDKYLTGGTVETESGSRSAPSLTKSGAGGWEARDITAFLRTGRRPDGSSINTEDCPVEFYRNAAEDDLHAVATYLKSL